MSEETKLIIRGEITDVLEPRLQAKFQSFETVQHEILTELRTMHDTIIEVKTTGENTLKQAEKTNGRVTKHDGEIVTMREKHSKYSGIVIGFASVSFIITILAGIIFTSLITRLEKIEAKETQSL